MAAATATATAAAAATISFHFPPARKRFATVCAIPTGFRSKPTKRKNYLRPKILKTLTKPYPFPHQFPPHNPIFPIESPPEQQQQPPEFFSDEFVIQEGRKTAGNEEQEPPVLGSDELSYHEVEGSVHIEMQPEVKETDGNEEKEPPELRSEQLSYHEVEGLDHIEMQQDYLSTEFSGEEVEDSAPIEQKFGSHNVEGSKSMEGKEEFLSGQFSGEGMKMFHSDIPFDQFASEEYDETDQLERLPELDVNQFAGEKIAISEVGEFSQSEETIRSPELVKPIAGNPFSSFSIVQFGLGFAGAVVIEAIWSTWMAKKVNANKKDQNLGIVDGNDNQKSELLLKENNGGHKKPNLEVLLKENNDGNNKPNSEVLLKENNDGNNKPNSEVLLKENSHGSNKPKSELLKENENSIDIKNEGAVLIESDMDKKIAEIRKLAREAREKEKLKSEGKGVDVDEDENDEDDLVPRKLEKSSKKKPLSPEGLAAEEARKTLMFKKKHKLKILGIDAKDTKPKGYTGRQDHGMTVIKTNGKLQNGPGNDNDLDVLDRDEQVDLPRVDLLDNVSTTSLEEEKGKKLPAKETARKQSSSRKKIVKERSQTKRRVTTSEQLKQSSSDVLGSSSLSLEGDKGKKLPAEESTQIQGSRKKRVKEKRQTKPRVTASEQSTVQEKPVRVEAQIFRNFIQSKRHDMQELDVDQTKQRVTTSEQLKQSRGDVLGSSSLSLEEDKGKKLPAEESTQIQGSRKKYVEEKKRTKPRVTASEQSTVQEKPVSVEAQIFQNFIQSKRHDMQESVSKKHDDLNVNGKLKINEVGTGKANNVLSGQKSYANTDFWWSSLPYVLTIVLRNDDGGSAGLYTLRITSQVMGDTIYRVAFEDHTDATNFCHIIEYFFKELDGFSAGITSTPTKELEAALKSKNMKVLVVKKGQVKLYAGQPLTDVEEALRSLVNQN